MTGSSSFDRYIDHARNGKTAFWRIVLGALVTVACWALTTGAVVVVGAFLSGATGPFNTGGEQPAQMVENFFDTPAGIAATLLSFFGMWIGVFLAVRLLHGRSIRTVLGTGDRLSWSGFARGLAAALIASALAELAFYLVDPSLRRSAIPLAAWLGWLVPLALLVIVQISAEELAFRGYLMQSLAARFRSPVIWGLLPGLLFTFAHWNADSEASMNGSLLITIAGFAAIAAYLVYRTGNLGAAMGTHFGMNLFALLIVSHMGWLDGAALFVSRPMEAPGWTVGESVWLAFINLASFAVILVLLLHRRSPLAVTEELDLPVAGTISSSD